MPRTHHGETRVGWLSLGLALLLLLLPGSMGAAPSDRHGLSMGPHLPPPEARPSFAAPSPSRGFVSQGVFSVNQTLVLANNSLLRGNVVPPAGSHPVFPFFDPLTGLLYISDTTAGTLLTLDPQNDTYLSPRHLGGSPDAIGLDPLNHLLYVTNLFGNSVTIVNATSGAVVANVTVGLAPSGVIFDPTNGAMLVTDQKSNQISIINATSNRLVANATGWGDPYGIAFDGADGHVFVTDHHSSSWDAFNCTGWVSVYNSSGSLAFLYNVSVGSDANGIAYDPINQDLYVADGDGCGLTAIAGRNDTPIQNFLEGPVGQISIDSAWGVSVDARTDHIFVTGPEYFPGVSGTVLMINGTDNKLGARTQVDGQLRWIADDPALGRLYAADEPAMDVTVLDAQSGTLLRDDLTGTLPGAMVFDPINRQLYVTDPNASVVLAVNTTTDTVAQRINAGPGAAGLAVDPSTGNVVVALTLESELVQINASTDRARGFASEVDQGVGGDYPTAELFTPFDQLLTSENNGYCPTAGGGSVGEEPPPGPWSCIDVRSPSSGAIESVRQIWGGPDGTSLAGNPVTRTYYFPVTNDNGTALDVLNDSSLNWTHQILVGSNDRGRWSGSGAGNDSVLYDLATNRIYFGNCGGNRVTVLNGTNFAFVGNISVPKPTALAYGFNDGLLFVASQNSSVAVVNGTTDQIVGSIAVGARPDGLAYDPLSNQLFVANNGSGTISILNLSPGPVARPVEATLATNATDVQAGMPVSLRLSVLGGVTGLHYVFGLPPGCASVDGPALTCTPTVPGTYWITAGVHDPWGRSWTANPVVLVVTRWLYPVVFNETGLPPGTRWGVIATFGVERSSSPIIQVFLPNSTGVGFYLTSVPGYSSSPAGERIFNVSGGGLTIPIRFVAVPATLTVVSFSADPATYRVGSVLTITVLAHGGTMPYRYDYSGLPPGCTSTDSSSFACTPFATGDFRLTVDVTDQSGQSASGNLSLVVAPIAVSHSGPSGPLAAFQALTPLEQIVLLGGFAAVAAGLAVLLRVRRRGNAG